MGLVISNVLSNGLRGIDPRRGPSIDSTFRGCTAPVALPRTIGRGAWAVWIGIIVVATTWHGSDPALLSLLVAPWVEEVLWRRGLHDSLRQRVRPWSAVGLVSLAVAACHVIALGILPGEVEPAAWIAAAATAVPAAVIGMAYQRYGHLGLCICAHALANAIWLACAS